jgi:serine/threonine protein kinase
MTPAHGTRTARSQDSALHGKLLTTLCFAHCAAALQNAHNIMVSRSSESPVRMTAKVTDMGLSSAIKHGSNSDSAKSVRLLSHVAPEVQRHGRAGPESDIYSFGILSEYLYGQRGVSKHVG